MYRGRMTSCTLTPAESSRLRELETIIENGINEFVRTGRALAEIRDTHLYRYGYDTFEDYADHRWGLSRSRAYQLMDYAEVSTMVDIDPQHPDAPFQAVVSERAARELVPLMPYPDKLRAVWDRSVEIAQGHPPTNTQVRQARREIENPRTPRTDPTEPPTVFAAFAFHKPYDWAERFAGRAAAGELDDDMWRQAVAEIDRLIATLDALKGLRS
jgi:hypothetical protein